MSPNGDMGTPEAQQQSFSLANMIPQAPKLNRVLWEGIESAVRNWAIRAVRVCRDRPCVPGCIAANDWRPSASLMSGQLDCRLNESQTLFTESAGPVKGQSGHFIRCVHGTLAVARPNAGLR